MQIEETFVLFHFINKEYNTYVNKPHIFRQGFCTNEKSKNRNLISVDVAVSDFVFPFFFIHNFVSILKHSNQVVCSS